MVRFPANEALSHVSSRGGRARCACRKVIRAGRTADRTVRRRLQCAKAVIHAGNAEIGPFRRVGARVTVDWGRTAELFQAARVYR